MNAQPAQQIVPAEHLEIILRAVIELTRLRFEHNYLVVESFAPELLEKLIRAIPWSVEAGTVEA